MGASRCYGLRCFGRAWVSWVQATADSIYAFIAGRLIAGAFGGACLWRPGEGHTQYIVSHSALPAHLSHSNKWSSHRAQAKLGSVVASSFMLGGGARRTGPEYTDVCGFRRCWFCVCGMWWSSVKPLALRCVWTSLRSSSSSSSSSNRVKRRCGNRSWQ